MSLISQILDVNDNPIFNWKKITILFIIYSFYQPASSQSRNVQLGDTLLAGKLNEKAIAFIGKKHYDSAIYNFQSAGNLFKQAEAWERYFYCQFQVGFYLNVQRKYLRSSNYLDSIEVNFPAKLTSYFSSYQRFYGVLAWSYYKQLRYDKALHYFDILIEGGLTNPDVSEKDLTYANYYKGTIFQRIGQYDLALKQMLISKELCLGDSTSDYLGTTYNNLGIIYRNLGEYERSIEFYKKALVILKETNKEVSLTPVYNNIGKVYLVLGQYEKANKELDYAINVLYNYTKDYYQVESALINTKANVLIELEQFDSAKQLLINVYNRELEKFGEAGPYSSETTLSLGKLYAKLGLLKKSNSYFDQSTEITESTLGLKNDKSAEAIKLKGQNQLKSFEFEKSARTFQKGIIGLVIGFNETDFDQNPTLNMEILDRVELVEILYLKAESLLELYKKSEQETYLINSFNTNKVATQLIEEIRINMLYESSIIKLSEKVKPIYEQSIKLALLLETEKSNMAQSSIFNAMESSKSYVLAGARQRAKSLGYSSTPDSVIKIESNLKINIKLLERELLTASIKKEDSDLIEKINQQLFAAKEAYESYEQSGPPRKKHKTNFVVPSIQEVQQKLTSTDLLVEYFASKEKLYAIAISKTNAKIYELGPYQEILDGLIHNMSQYQQLLANEYQQVAFKVYNSILEPILTDFRHTKRLIIIPDKQIGHLPFDALVSIKKEEATFSNLNYLLADYTILQHQSAGLYIATNTPKVAPEKQYIGYAPNFSSQELLQAESRPLRGNLQPLPFAQKEVELIAKLLTGEVEIGAEANESNFKLLAPNYNILHIASHAVVNNENPIYSKLIFSNIDSLQKEDGNLYSFEIYGMDLSSNLVTLSACNTGNGKYYDGEGIFSLGRAFLMAGANSVLSSLWEVPDQSTSMIMESFYRNLKEGSNKPEALRIAKLDYLKKADHLTANPYYWAGFVYTGTPEIVYKSNKIYYMFGGLMLLLISFIALYKRKK